MNQAFRQLEARRAAAEIPARTLALLAGVSPALYTMMRDGSANFTDRSNDRLSTALKAEIERRFKLYADLMQ